MHLTHRDTLPNSTDKPGLNQEQIRFLTASIAAIPKKGWTLFSRAEALTQSLHRRYGGTVWMDWGTRLITLSNDQNETVLEQFEPLSHQNDRAWVHRGRVDELDCLYFPFKCPDGKASGLSLLVGPDFTEHDLVMHLLEMSLPLLCEAAEYEVRSKGVEANEELLATVSHDLKNPLTAVLTSAGLLKSITGEKGDTDPVRELVQKLSTNILFAVERMNELVRDLQDRSSLTAGRVSLCLRNVAPSKLVAETRILMDSIAASRRCKLICSIDRTSEAHDAFPDVICDEKRVLQVLSNLIGNATQHSRPGSQIHLKVRAVPGWVEFCVSDSGRGIPAAQQPNVFRRYWRASENSYSGSGLGLSICKELVERQGGKIWFESDTSGTRFTFSLPAAVRSGQ